MREVGVRERWREAPSGLWRERWMGESGGENPSPAYI
jgi:hypothetical protein